MRTPHPAHERLGRIAYALAWRVALPAVALRLWWRGRREPGYRAHVGERFGRYRQRAPTIDSRLIWVHAVSLGETNAAKPLVERMLREFPDATVLLTHMTATGRAAGGTIASERVVQCWLPYDVPSFVAAFFDRFRPAAGILVETELWPSLLAEARARRIPVFVVNARLSERSAAGYRRIGSHSGRMLSGLAGVAAQTEQDAERLRALGAPAPCVTGNLKFDVALPANARAAGAAIRRSFAGGRPVVLLASTRDGEEALLMDAWRAKGMAALLIVVPRHPQRFDEVARLLEARSIPHARRSGAAVSATQAPDVLLGDSMGEMAAYCAASDVVIMGGSLLPHGGQNLIEPLALGRPVIVGPHMFNFAAATREAIAAGAALRVDDASTAVDAAHALLVDTPRRERMQRAALTFHAAHRGALDRLWSWLGPKLRAALVAHTDHAPETERPQPSRTISRRGGG